MNKQQILEEIKRIASVNDGAAPGEKLFKSETGVRKHEWRGKYWIRWGDALREAGFEANKWGEGYDGDYVLGRYAELIRELGRIPVESELQLKRGRDSSFPSVAPFKRVGSKAALLERVRKYCEARNGYKDVLALFEKLPKSGTAKEKRTSVDQQSEDGFVYLLKSGRHYKIGRSVSAGQRERQLKIQLPEKADVIHSIKTDDPVGIEAYWHKRFAVKRKNGEWFELNSADVSTFKRRKFM